MSGDDRLAPLSYAVRPRVIAKYLGQVGVMIGLVTLVPFAASILFGEFHRAVPIGVVVAAIVTISVPLTRMDVSQDLQANEVITVAALSFLLSPVLMVYPLTTMGLAPIDAFFEAVSAITTTGLSTLPHVEEMSRTFLFSRAWMQWSGGLGIVVFSLALLMGHEPVSRRLFELEGGIENIVATVRTHARRVLVVYLSLTIVSILILWAMHVDLFTAVVQVLAAVSTGGFSSFDTSLAGLHSWPAAYVVIAISLCGAFPLYLYYASYARGVRLWIADIEVRALLVAVLATTVLLIWTLSRGMPTMSFGDVLRHAPLLAVSAQSTTGFTSLPIGDLDPASKLIMIVSMALGGSVGSTAGGIKILRLLILLRVLQLALRRTGMPSRAVAEPRLAGRRLEGDEIEKALILLALFVAVVLISWVPFVATGLDPLDALFEVVSASGTVGLSTGVTSLSLPAGLKGVLCLDMLFGRLEVVALLVVLYPPTWFGNRKDSQ